MDKYILKRLNEELKKSDISSEIDKYINSQKFKDKSNSIFKDNIKSNKEFEDKVVEISTNVLTQLFKTFWVKRSFWSNKLSNKAN
jgi:hypothetical protein